MTAKLAITRGLFVLLDEADLERAAAFSWTATPQDKVAMGHYACTHIAGRTVYMHRWLLEAPKGRQVDHINRDGLDNRRANLRLCNQSQNNANAQRLLGRSGLRGVYWDSQYQKWAAAIWINGKERRLGRFADKFHAARIRDAAAKEAYGEFATLNFPESA